MLLALLTPPPRLQPILRGGRGTGKSTDAHESWGKPGTVSEPRWERIQQSGDKPSSHGACKQATKGLELLGSGMLGAPTARRGVRSVGLGWEHTPFH